MIDTYRYYVLAREDVVAVGSSTTRESTVAGVQPEANSGPQMCAYLQVL